MKKQYIWSIIFFITLLLLTSYALYNLEKNKKENNKNSVSIQNSIKQESVEETEKPSYPIDTEVFTTLERTIIPVEFNTWATILPYEVEKYAQNGYWKWMYGSGLAYEKRLDLMPSNYNDTWVISIADLLNFFSMTDIHLTDEESPAQAIYFWYKGWNSSAYSPVMMLSTQILDSAIQTINTINKQKPVDFIISLWDNINNNQYNELRWFIDILDGKLINPDSGKKDDPIAWPLNDYQDEFKAAGLDKSIPWYQTLGNHDHFWMWSYPVDDYIKPFYTGENILDLGAVFTDPKWVKSRWVYNGAIDWSTKYGDVIWAWLTTNFTSNPKVIADQNRHSLSTNEWISEFFKTSSEPKGHWFSQKNIDENLASYTFEPKSDLPIKVIVLDDTQKDTDFDIHWHGYLNQVQYDWLINELEKGQKEGKLMIIAAHLPIATIWISPNSIVSAKPLVEKLQNYPNLALWISWHRHRNNVTAWRSGDKTHPENGFWEVETSSLRDFPQQMRNFNIEFNNNKTISIFTTNVDVAVKKDSLAELARSYTIASLQIFNIKLDNPPAWSYNAELVKTLTTEMQNKFLKYLKVSQN